MYHANIEKKFKLVEIYLLFGIKDSYVILENREFWLGSNSFILVAGKRQKYNGKYSKQGSFHVNRFIQLKQQGEIVKIFCFLLNNE